MAGLFEVDSDVHGILVSFFPSFQNIVLFFAILGVHLVRNNKEDRLSFNPDN